MASPVKEFKKPAQLPPPNSDFYELVETLPAEELAVVKQVRTFMEAKVAPVINKYWAEDAFPFELLPGIAELNIVGVGFEGLRLSGRQRLAGRLYCHGDGAGRLLDRDFLWRAQRAGHGLDLSWRIGRAEAEMAAPMARLEKSDASD